MAQQASARAGQVKGALAAARAAVLAAVAPKLNLDVTHL
jgi:hypothetical protein